MNYKADFHVVNVDIRMEIHHKRYSYGMLFSYEYEELSSIAYGDLTVAWLFSIH